MVKDNRRIAPPSNCTPFRQFQVQKSETVIDPNGGRLDGRKSEDLRPINLKPGVVTSVTGSAYMEWGNTKVIASINGPRDVLHKTDSLSKGQLYCEFKYATFSCKELQPYVPTDEEMSLSKTIQEALEPVILLHKFPKARLDIFIICLENDGSVVSAAITCAGVALSNAGVEMYDLPVSCSLVNTGVNVVIDPTLKEEHYAESSDFARATLGMMPAYNNQVIYMNSTGKLKPQFLSSALKTLRSKCQIILAHIKNHLKMHIKKKAREAENEDVDVEVDHIKPAELKLFQPQKYMNAHLENNIRPDGRALNEFRPILVSIGAIGTADGSALVRLNDTSVLCGIKAQLAMPTSEEPNKGFIVPNITLTPVCSNKFQPGPPGELAQAYSRLIMDLIKDADLIDCSVLCLSEGKLSWCLFVEMTCLSHDGNILDACVLSMLAALRNTKLPEVTLDTEEDKVIVKDTLLPLNLNCSVYPASFALVNNIALADPTEEEENLASGTLTVFVKELNSVSVQSYGVIKEENVTSSIKCAKSRYTEIKNLIQTFN